LGTLSASAAENFSFLASMPCTCAETPNYCPD